MEKVENRIIAVSYKLEEDKAIFKVEDGIMLVILYEFLIKEYYKKIDRKRRTIRYFIFPVGKTNEFEIVLKKGTTEKKRMKELDEIKKIIETESFRWIRKQNMNIAGCLFGFHILPKAIKSFRDLCEFKNSIKK